ncbi:TIGR00266 family protein [Methanonatronarchaeum sp. AMET6-2]|uniref:TIGR00266 family protein n=1 Tax=Methanonatronarchaeum sp. AMET6-2 TaxID=2933293 RepID=UPI00120E21F8|nr:TIGR00266 family protein [Methanonatronarchaeum sp. AMET6-2]RZN63253.1 MAG: TIGR00266 family protein [Methanonatronarchaeia archaeon]UOY10485.1 TIGR00266 family protein [Methanonatronarchaeum sp. AMET6-2]
MDYNIEGTVMPFVELTLDKGETIYSETGNMKFMGPDIKMETKSKGGLTKALKRRISGGGTFLNFFEATEDGAKVSFGHTYPGKILEVDVAEKDVVCQKRSFLCAEESVDYDVSFQKKIGTGFFGGEGFVLQKLSGDGMAFVEIDGECHTVDLDPGESIKVETGSVGMFEDTVDMSIDRVKGVKNVLFGGEGFFLTTLTGPGKVWLQTMPIQNLTAEMSKYLEE